jgi:hypothetical protein
MTKVDIYLKEYQPHVAGADPVYRLRVTYQALAYWPLIDLF